MLRDTALGYFSRMRRVCVFSRLRVRFLGLEYFLQEKANFVFERLQRMLTLANASILDSFTKLSKEIFIV